jgi:hypothetical protein
MLLLYAYDQGANHYSCCFSCSFLPTATAALQTDQATKEPMMIITSIKQQLTSYRQLDTEQA